MIIIAIITIIITITIIILIVTIITPNIRAISPIDKSIEKSPRILIDLGRPAHVLQNEIEAHIHEIRILVGLATNLS